MSADFKSEMYREAKQLFPAGEIETLVKAPASIDPGDVAVRLVHKKSGLSASCDRYPTQLENFVAAAIRLKIECDQEAYNQTS